MLLPQAVTQFEELVGMAEALLKGGGTMSTSASTLWRATNNSSPDSFASTCSNSNSSSPDSLKPEEEHQTDEKQVRCKGLIKFLVCCYWFFTGVTKQLFPNTDDVSIRRMIGQKLNNCTKKPNVSKNLNSQDIK
ncbi:PREDICTED: BEN domain-containing protein 6 [Rhinopithecus bieti]|uniref:BEN domain-containing protein 6 n=1 Tax=Rhinopithecus bieti TaxID=61621 RepID=UPI00083C8E71|nr:PREDICTED: BEN domain-containing protein 6 [Rhinopithecus bieti]